MIHIFIAWASFLQGSWTAQAIAAWLTTGSLAEPHTWLPYLVLMDPHFVLVPSLCATWALRTILNSRRNDFHSFEPVQDDSELPHSLPCEMRLPWSSLEAPHLWRSAAALLTSASSHCFLSQEGSEGL